jgi:hypothetical protein
VGGTCGMHGRWEKCSKSFGLEAQSEEPLERPRCRWEDNIGETEINGTNWIQLAQGSPMVSFCEHGNEPLGYIKKAGYSLTS